MAETAPQINLTRVEQYQASRTNAGLPQEDLLALSWRIATQPGLHRRLIPNPYAQESKQTIAESFPGINRSDVIKATVLAEPEGEYDRKFKQLSLEEQREMLYQQIDKSASTTVRLAKYLQKRPEAFWDMSEEHIYSLLSEAAFGTADPSGIEKNFAQNQRRGFRLSIVNFIEDLQTLKPYHQEFQTDARATASRIFGKPIEGDIEIESLPVGFIVYLDKTDYERLNPSREVGEVPGGTIATWPSSSFPSELLGKVIVINRGTSLSAEALKTTREHEVRHILFGSFAAERDSTYALDTEKAVDKLVTVQDYKQYAENLRKFFAEYAKNELISYYGSNDIDYKFLGQLGGDKWLEHLEIVRNNLWVRENLTPEQKASTYVLYTNKFADYLAQIREYQWIAQRLFKSSSLSVEKAEALLQNTPFDKARRLGRYFGVNPDEIPAEISKEQEQMVRRFSLSVDNLMRPSVKGLPLSEQPLVSWSGVMDWDVQSQVRLTYPREAIPSLLKAIEGFSKPDVVDEAIYSTELILYMHHKGMSQQDLTQIRTALENMVSKRSGNDFTRVKTEAKNLIQTIDEVYMQGGVDFVHHMPLVAKVANLMRTPEGQSPTIDQISQLVELLKGGDMDIWTKYFKKEYVDNVLMGAEGIPVAIRLAEVAGYAGFTIEGLSVLESNLDKLTPETKKRALAVIENVLSRNYKVGPIDVTDKVRPYALQVKNEVENS